MADSSPYPTRDTDIGGPPDRDSKAGTPRWVKVFGIVAALAFLLFIIVMATGGSRMRANGQPSGNVSFSDGANERWAAGLRCVTPDGGR